LSIPGEHDVEFQCVDADFKRFGEGPQRLLGGLTAPGAMGLQVES